MKSPNTFHSGELKAQDKAGTRGVAAELLWGKRSSLNFSSNHDAFIAAQSFAVMSSVNLQTDEVWVSPLFGKAGDLTALSEDEIVISPRCIPESDVLNLVEPGTPLSLLGIDLNKRVRHRINGSAMASRDRSDTRLHLQVEEYSPNCPKYINRREIVYAGKNVDSINRTSIPQIRYKLSESDQAFVSSMDTLWIGSYAPGVGADTNHRGGRPGFIRVVSPSIIEWPEYRGNGTFYTSGNLESHDRAGITVVDFKTGSMIQMTGRATVNWSHDGRYEGATRTMTFHIEKLVRTDNVTSHRWKLLDYSPYNPQISGTSDNDSLGDLPANEFPVKANLAKIVEENDNVKTFRFLAQRNIKFLPGQYATFKFNNIPGGAESEIRTWTLSETPNSINGDNTLDISVKRVKDGLVTNWLHDHAELGMSVTLNGIQGEMTAVQVDTNTGKPVVPQNLLLISAGIGITPNIAMVRGVGAFELQEQTRITMIHVERYEKDLMFQHELNRRTVSYPNFKYTNIISSEQGRPTLKHLRELVPDAQFQNAYLCGPVQFMSDMTEYLVMLGVLPDNIHTESFEF